MKNKSALPKHLYEESFWDQTKDPLWIVSVLTLSRNCSAYPFYGKMSDLQKKQVNERITQVLQETPWFKNHTTFTTNNLSAQDKDILYEHFMLESGTEALDPQQTLILDERANTLALINLDNHLQLRFLINSKEEKSQWGKISELDDYLNTKLMYAFSERFGFLTTNPTESGTGLVVQSFLHLPAHTLLKKIEETASTLPNSLQVRSLQESEEYLGDLVILENRYKVGYSEEQILALLEKGANILIKREKQLYKELIKASPPDIKNTISRALGLLKHAYQLSALEAINALSIVELGKRLEWIGAAEDIHFAPLAFGCLKGHLNPELRSSQERLQERASFLSAHCQNLKLLF